MDEIPAFSRRHTPRHGIGGTTSSHTTVDYTRDNDVVLLSARDRLDALAAGHNSGGSAASAIEAPRSNSKTRKHAATPSTASSVSSSATIVKAVVNHAGASRKMSGGQLRMFFLLCVALYFAVICFADDIVKFAQWVGDDDNAAAWKAAIATTPAPSKAIFQPRIDGDNKPDKVVMKDATKNPVPSDGGEAKGNNTTTTADTKNGHLRGEEGATEAAASAAPVDPAAATAIEAATPAVLVKKEAEATTVAAMTPPPMKANENENEKKREAATVMSQEPVSHELLEEHQADDKHVKTAIEKPGEAHLVDDSTHKPVDDDQDAPLDSVEEREREARGHQTAVVKTSETTPTTTEVVAAPAEVPKTAAGTQLPVVTQTEGQVPAATFTQLQRNDDGAKDPNADR